MIRFLVLVGYLEMSMYLYLTGKLDQYINTHYTYLAIIAMILSFLLAIVQLTIWVKQLKLHSHFSSTRAARLSPLILILPVLVALTVPTVTLDATTVAAKGYQFPLAEGSNAQVATDDGQTIQYLKPDTSTYFTSATYHQTMAQALAKYEQQETITITASNYMEVMELIYLYPDRFLGRDITYTGFIYNEPGHQDYQFLFRFGIIHCIADSGVYGLLTTNSSHQYPDDSWLTVTGRLKLEYDQLLNQTLPVLHITKETIVSKPSNPYVYRTF